MKESEAAYVGFAVALCIPALVGGILTPIMNGKPDWQTVLGLFPIVYLFSALFATPLFIPAYIFAKRRKLIRWWSTIIMGVVIGAVVSMWIGLRCYNTPLGVCIKDYAPTTSTWSGVGGLSGLVFWIIWRQHKEAA